MTATTLRKLPPKLKIYEALGALADQRIEVDNLLGYSGVCHSADTKGKTYTIIYNPETNTITSNDNGSMNQGYIGYPAVAFLLKVGKISYNPEILPLLKGIQRSKLKYQVHKDHEATLRLLLGNLLQQEVDVDRIVHEVEKIYQELEELKLHK